ncbi:hypothetical protein U1Q18_052357 [Sarracenia purpurea var. burkii]
MIATLRLYTDWYSVTGVSAARKFDSKLRKQVTVTIRWRGGDNCADCLDWVRDDCSETRKRKITVDDARCDNRIPIAIVTWLD